MARVTLQTIFQDAFPAYEQTHPLPAHVRKAARAIIQCRTAALGGHVQECPEGHIARVWYNSCRHRACPQCAFLQPERWLTWQRARLLACDHYHQAWAREALTLPEPRCPQQVLNLLKRLGHPTKTRWNVRIMERYRHGAGVVPYLARYLRGGPLKNARLVACHGDRITCTYRARHAEPHGRGSAAQRMTLSRGDLLQRWLLHVPAPQSRVVRSYGLYHHTHAEALAVSRMVLGQPPVEVPERLPWQTVCAQRGALHPEQCPLCGQLLVSTGIIPRGGAPPRPWSEECAA
jgi:Transposase zinc-binding domain/Putative transposase